MSTAIDFINSMMYSAKLRQTQSKIDDLQSTIRTGTVTLSNDQQSEVTKLSDKATKLSKADTSISDAKKTIDLAQTGLDAIAGTLRQMQMLATQVSGSNMSYSDTMFLNLSFQNQLSEIGKSAVSAKYNGVNLLSGTAGLNVQIGADSGSKSMMRIPSINVYGLVTMGTLSGAGIASADDANSALDGIRNAMATVTSGQATLKALSKQLTTHADSVAGQTTATNKAITSLTTPDVDKLKSNLAILRNQQYLDIQIYSQLTGDATAYLKFFQ